MAILILLGVSVIIYFLVRLMPVNYVEDKISAINQGGAMIDESAREAMYEVYGLTDNSLLGILKGYFNWLKSLLTFDLGISFKYAVPVTDVIFEHMGSPRSVTLAPPSLVTLPPVTALVSVIWVTVAVVTVGDTTSLVVVNVFSSP